MTTRVACKLCSWSHPCNDAEHGEFLVTLHIRAKHDQPGAAVNRCLAAMAVFPWAVQVEAARHILEGQGQQ